MNNKLAHLTGGPLFERNQDATIYAGNLDNRVSEEIIWELFLQCGPIANVHIPRDKVTNEHQGFGFVEFNSEEDADYSIKILHMVKLYGKPVKVNKASQDKKTQEVGANVFVGNLHEEVDEKMLRDVFSSFGIVLSTKIMRDPETGQSKRYGFVSFDNFESSDAAIQSMDGQYLCGKPIDVSYAYKKEAGGEKHGSLAERVLAHNRPNQNQTEVAARQFQKFQGGAGTRPQPPQGPLPGSQMLQSIPYQPMMAPPIMMRPPPQGYMMQVQMNMPAPPGYKPPPPASMPPHPFSLPPPPMSMPPPPQR